MDLINKELNENDKKEVELVVDRISDLKGIDKLYFQLLIKNTIKKNFGINILNQNLLHPDNLNSAETFWPPNDPNWFKMSASSGKSSEGKKSSESNKGGAAEEKAPVKEVIINKIICRKLHLM